MVTTTCKELVGSDCAIPLKGNNVQELQQTVFAHAKQHHPDVVKTMTPNDQAKMTQRIQEIYNQKAGVSARN